ncbi:hypothetical protein IW261DRAFT_1605961 [Armillaria novae-zelandiae]|uniref:Uncharacterized protein n=1 Tax=Armillaria novae-zelandiae TaxID=153914 RepID=A0AA39UC53_9AGAR|nr:hypothetical protein IW261DRAFT_1605961 [Armillaria novae-zelandiae]
MKISFRVPVQREDDDGEHICTYIQVYPFSKQISRIDPDDDENVLKLNNSLEQSSMCYSNIPVADIVQILVPASRRVKGTHHVRRTHVDDDFGKGLWDLLETYKKMAHGVEGCGGKVKDEHEAALVDLLFQHCFFHCLINPSRHVQRLAVECLGFTRAHRRSHCIGFFSGI